MESDPHSEITEAAAQLEGLRGLLAQLGPAAPHYMTADQLDAMLMPVSNRFDRALAQLAAEP